MPTKEGGGNQQQPFDKTTGKYTENSSKQTFSFFGKEKSKLKFVEKMREKEKQEATNKGFSSVEEYKKTQEIEKQKRINEYEKEKQFKVFEKQKKENNIKQQIKEDIKNAPQHKKEQFDILQKENPMLDDYHIGVRSPKDIKYFNEVIGDKESFSWGDYTKEDAERDLKKGKITIYSSYPIKQGTFVSTSKRQAQEYAGGEGKKVYQLEIPLDKVAWLSGDEGQFADINFKK